MTNARPLTRGRATHEWSCVWRATRSEWCQLGDDARDGHQLLIAICDMHSTLPLILPPTKKEVYVFARVRLSVCLSVSKITQNGVHGFGWNVACDTDVETWTNWLTFEPDLGHSPDAGTWLLSPISYALQRGILLHRENPTYRYWPAATRNFKMVLRPTASATRGFTMVSFTASRRNNFVGGTCALPSALLVLTVLSRLDRGIQSETEMLPLKRGRQCCT